MSLVACTFKPESLANTVVDIGNSDDEIGAALARLLAGLGAELHLRGDRPASLEMLQQEIRNLWGRAQISREMRNRADSAIRILSSVDALLAHLDGDKPVGGALDIAILTTAVQPGRLLGRLQEEQDRGCRVHVINLPSSQNGDNQQVDFEALGALVVDFH